MDYDAEAHQQVRQQVASQRRFDAAHHALNEAQANLPGISESLQTGRQMLAERQADMDAAAERMNTLKQDIESLPTLTAEARRSRMHGSDQTREQNYVRRRSTAAFWRTTSAAARSWKHRYTLWNKITEA